MKLTSAAEVYLQAALRNALFPALTCFHFSLFTEPGLEQRVLGDTEKDASK